jgi:acetolactate synthase-1/3 small subunit
MKRESTISMEKHAISLLVSNRPGVLIRIALVFSRRGYNLDSVVVSPAHHPEFSRMTIVASGDVETLAQIIKQLNKLVDVVHAKDHTGESMIEREIALIKVGCSEKQRTEVLRIIDQFAGESVDTTGQTITFQATGTSAELDRLEHMLDTFNIVESVRSGKLIIARGQDAT